MAAVIDVALLRTDPDLLTHSLQRRHLDVDVAALVELDERRRRVRTRAEELRADQKRSGREIAALEGDEKRQAIAAAAALADEYKALLAEADRLDAQFEGLWVPLPNPPHSSVPDGESEEDNVEISRWGEPPEFTFEARDHVDLGTALGIIDIDRAVRLSGSRFAYLKGAAVVLEFALVRFGLDRLSAAGFTPVVPPVLVRSRALFGTGFFPGARDQVYAVGSNLEDGAPVEPDDLYLAGTAEVPLAGLHIDEILTEELPVRYAGFSTCFRREAGTYGKDTRGMFRVHQFDKLEMFSFCHPDASWAEHEFLLEIEEGIVRDLELPYRVVNVCTGDLGDSAAKKYDIEAWMPGQGTYREITSCSNTTDYQTRRLMIRFRDDGGTRLVHTLNGTAIAVGRTLIALLENHQQDDGSVLLPEALQPYAGMERISP
jgi:seryl-tRNA synthetase